MAHKNIHTTYNSDARNWRNITEGAAKPAKVYDTKAKALVAGRQVAKSHRVEHLIHNKNGEIGSRNSYGHDPRNVKG